MNPNYPQISILKKHEGKCVGIANGKVVISSKSLTKVMRILNKDYFDSETYLLSVPKGNKIFI